MERRICDLGAKGPRHPPTYLLRGGTIKLRQFIGLDARRTEDGAQKHADDAIHLASLDRGKAASALQSKPGGSRQIDGE